MPWERAIPTTHCKCVNLFHKFELIGGKMVCELSFRKSLKLVSTVLRANFDAKEIVNRKKIFDEINGFFVSTIEMVWKLHLNHRCTCSKVHLHGTLNCISIESSVSMAISTQTASRSARVNSSMHLHILPNHLQETAWNELATSKTLN